MSMLLRSLDVDIDLRSDLRLGFHFLFCLSFDFILKGLFWVKRHHLFCFKMDLFTGLIISTTPRRLMAHALMC